MMDASLMQAVSTLEPWIMGYAILLQIDGVSARALLLWMGSGRWRGDKEFQKIAIINAAMRLRRLTPVV